MDWNSLTGFFYFEYKKWVDKWVQGGWSCFEAATFLEENLGFIHRSPLYTSKLKRMKQDVELTDSFKFYLPPFFHGENSTTKIFEGYNLVVYKHNPVVSPEPPKRLSAAKITMSHSMKYWVD